MSLLGRKWPVPVARPMAPFFIAGAIVYYGIWKLEDKMINSEEWRNDPRNPNPPTAQGPGEKHAQTDKV